MRNTVDFDKDIATVDAAGNVTAKNQSGTDAQGKPHKKSDKKPWRFGDSLRGIKPTRVAGVQPMNVA